MTPESNGRTMRDPVGGGERRPPASVQILLGLKSADPTAQTAHEAIEHLLGFGSRLVSVHRRMLHEWVLSWDEEPAALLAAVIDFLDRTAVFWNPHKQRGWVRLDGAAGGLAEMREGCEILPGGRRRTGPFGTPDLTEESYDHLLVWNRGEECVPPDLPEGLRGRLLACGRGELYTLRWRRGADPAERHAWTEAVGVARSRAQGLLVNPHYQDHRQFQGAVPLPLWSG